MARQFLRILVVLATAVAASGFDAVSAADSGVDLESLDPEQILSKLDLTRPGLEAVKAGAEAGRRHEALEALLAYYRDKYPLPEPSPATGDFTTADRIVDHVLQWGPYEPADYGPEIDWEWDPRGDIEWVAAVYRFYWAAPLGEAYRATRDAKYARAFVEMTSDWIAKHPLENRRRVHPVYTSWRGFAWLDIQTGIRADNLCRVFPVFVHAEAFTPDFLARLLASLYDHQVKTEKIPMGVVHNKAIFEQRGFVHVAHTFPEFRDSRRWMELALKRSRENFLAQTTADGVQREWSFGYNLGVLRDAVDIMKRVESAGIAAPDDYRDRIRKMYDYLLAIGTPELAGPMFGDASRSVDPSTSRTRWPLYSYLVEATELFGDPKYAARAKLDPAALPEQTSYAFAEAGMYVMRDRWGPEQIYFALHCSPRGISGHDQPDNGTFELCAFGRWLMPDSGFYTYGHDPAGRRWHRQTRVHQTLTLDGKDTRIAGRHLGWSASPEHLVATVENGSYPGLAHRRTVWFVDRRFFVLLDEAIGEAQGTLELHFQLAPGEAEIHAAERWAATAFDDANVLVWAPREAPLSMHEEEGWYACRYGHREPRKAFCYRHAQPAPAAFLTVVVPYRGAERPEVKAALAGDYEVGAARADVTVALGAETWRLTRALNDREP